jgi:RNA polymerase sigma-70 factor, ECF subfamily
MEIKSQLSDAKILKDSQDHPWMFGMLVDRYQKAFLRKGLFILRSQDDAEDAVQDTFIKIYKHAHQFAEKRNASFQSWAYKILTNTCYDYSSQKIINSRRVQLMDFAGLDDISSGIEFFSDKEQTSFVQSVLARLPQRLSRLLSLYFFEDKSYEEIAFLERISLSAVRSNLYRARRQFKDLALKMI